MHLPRKFARENAIGLHAIPWALEGQVQTLGATHRVHWFRNRRIASLGSGAVGIGTGD